MSLALVQSRLGGGFRRRDSSPKIRFAPDSPLEGDGFELSVPRQRRDPLATDNQGEEVRFALDSLLEEDGSEASGPGE
jgi:hypothetical protein